MVASLDMTLDDMVKRNKGERSRGRGNRPRRGRGGQGQALSGGRMSGSRRGGPLAVNARPSQNAIVKSARRRRSLPWQQDLLEDSLTAFGISAIETGTRVYVSNLDHGVTNADIRELFAEIGELKRYAIHYDKNGRPSGSAEVVYVRRSDAFAAHKRYNNVLLDGKPMKIEVAGAIAEVPVSARINVSGVKGRKKRTVVMTPGLGQVRASAGTQRAPGQNRPGVAAGAGKTRNSRGRPRGKVGRGSGKKKPANKSADDLDKELENYHAEAMNVA